MSLPAYRVIFEDGTSYVTSMSKETSLDDARHYFVGQELEQPDGSIKRVKYVEKGRWDYKDLSASEIMSLRINRHTAYKAGQYKFHAPPVCTARWDDEAWMNWIEFNNPDLTGFLPYTNRTAEDGILQG